jgi:hypothetical protein
MTDYFNNFRDGRLGGGEEVGVAPDAPLAVGAATERGEDVASVFAGFASGDGCKRYFEKVPAYGEIAADGDLLNVGAALESDELRHGAESRGELLATHRRTARCEEGDIVSHQIELCGEVAGGGGFSPGVDEGANLLGILIVCRLAYFFVSFSRAVRTMSLVRSSGSTSGAEFTGAG